MAFNTGTMRGMALRSWRPPTTMVAGLPSVSTVAWGRPMEGMA
jgi:hypothetical protein